MTTLTLNTDGPTPSPLPVSSGGAVSIVNNLGADVTLTLSNAGLLNPSSGTSLTVPSAGWSGTVGNSSGTYSYSDSSSTKRATRNGRINVG
jgi:hypothetical protein